MKNRLISIVSFLVLVAIIVWYLSDVERRSTLLEQISSIDKLSFSLITLGTFGFIFFQGYVLKYSVRPYGVELKFWEYFGIIIVTFFSNYIIPFLGFGIRGVYLNKRHGLSVRNFSQSLIGVLIIEWAIFAAIALLAALWLFSHNQPMSLSLIGVMVLIVLGFFFAVLVRPSWIPSFLPLSSFAKSILEDWQSYLKNRRDIIRVAGFTFLEAICFAFAFVVAYHALFPQIPAAASVFAASLSDLSLIIRILPASAGSLEAALHLAMLPYGLTFADNLSIAIITRLALAVIFIPLGPVFALYLLQKREQ